MRNTTNLIIWVTKDSGEELSGRRYLSGSPLDDGFRNYWRLDDEEYSTLRSGHSVTIWERDEAITLTPYQP